MLQPWKEKNGLFVKLADTYSAYHEALLEAPHSEDFLEVANRLKEKLIIV